MKAHEENKPDSKQNWKSEKELSVHLVQMDLQKRPGMLHKFRVSGCGLESRQGFPNVLGSIQGWPGTRNDPALLAVSVSF